MRKLGIVLCIVLLATAAVAQTRTRRSTPQRRRAPATASTTLDTAAQAKTEGASRIAIQIKNLTAFLYLYGRISKDLEVMTTSGQASPTTDRNKAQLKTSFEDFRVGLDQLEIYFRTTPGLQGYYVKLAGAAAGAAAGEEQAAAGRYDQAGKSLLGVVGRLVDVLAIMH
ncbi:MAG TPA: hypothetical protein VFX97_20125 [Pyrinomonadaceae bacterium]|nr:hypothetical protein [Pyrinomonadaceae bacterium]